MMVLLRNSVECSAKIAMTTLHRGRGAMCLLPIHDLPRLIFLDARDVTNLSFLEWARQPACSAKCDTKVNLKASSAALKRVRRVHNRHAPAPVLRNDLTRSGYQ